MDQNCCDFGENSNKSTLEKPVKVVQEKNGDTPLKENQLSILNRRSYNEYIGSENFINLLGDDHGSGRDRLKSNIKPLNVVSSVLHSGGEEMRSNDKYFFCWPSMYLTRKGSCSSCLKSSLHSRVSMDVVSHSEFASQTLKPFSILNLDSNTFEEREFQNGNVKYSLKESNPGCIPGKRKSKKLQRKASGRTNQNKESDRNKVDPIYNEKGIEGDLTDSYNNDSEASGKVARRKSFLSSLKFIKFGKFGKKKKRQEDLNGASESSNWDTESAESFQEREHEDNTPYKDDGFVFGGVRVFIDENGECYEVDEGFDAVSSNSTLSDDESQSSNEGRYIRTKFESRDSLNLGYSGSFVT